MPSRARDAATFDRVLADACRGDQAAVAVLFNDLQPRLLRFLRATEPRSADDIASDVWVSIAQGLGSFRGGQAEFRAWAFTITRRRLADHRRRGARRPVDLPGDQAFSDLPTVVTSDGAAIANMSAQDAVATIIGCLPTEQAEVVLLRIVGDLDARQVGQVLGRSEGWVRINQLRALQKLAERFGA